MNFSVVTAAVVSMFCLAAIAVGFVAMSYGSNLIELGVSRDGHFIWWLGLAINVTYSSLLTASVFSLTRSIRHASN